MHALQWKRKVLTAGPPGKSPEGLLKYRSLGPTFSRAPTEPKNLHVYKIPDNHDGVITHLEPDILECEV